MIFHIIYNRSSEPIAMCDDLEVAGRIVDALMRTRHDDDQDYWACDTDGNEFYWDPNWNTVFSAACFETAAANGGTQQLGRSA